MRTLAVVLLALVAIAAGGLWMFAEFGRPADPAPIAAPAEEPLVAESPELSADVAAAEPENPAPSETPAPAPARPRHDLTSKDAAPPPAAAAPRATAVPDVDTQPAEPAPQITAAAASAAEPGTPAALDAARREAAKALPDALRSAAGKLAPRDAKPASPQSSLAESQPAPPAAQSAVVEPAPQAPAAEPRSVATASPAQSAPPAERRVQPTRVAEAAPAETAPAEAAASPLASEFKSRQVAYNRPPSRLVLGRPIDVSLVINATADEEAAREALEGFKGEIVERDVDLSNIVSAQLTGVGFDIVTQSVERQKLSDRTLNRWQWRITPTEPGSHTLILEIFGYESGALEAEPLDAYRDEIVVEVRELDRLVNLAQRYQPVFAVVAGAAGAISALLALLRFRAERKKK